MSCGKSSFFKQVLMIDYPKLLPPQPRGANYKFGTEVSKA